MCFKIRETDMCTGPVGNGQSYWGLIQLKITGGGITDGELAACKSKLTAFLNGQTVTSGLPAGVQASLANGTIKTDDEGDGAAIQLVKGCKPETFFAWNMELRVVRALRSAGRRYAHGRQLDRSAQLF